MHKSVKRENINNVNVLAKICLYHTFQLCLSPPFVFTFSIGYPVVYLGFYATCYFTNIFKLRIQKAVQSENDFHMHLLQHSLPPGLQVYPKTGTDGSSSESSASSIYTHFLPGISCNLQDDSNLI